MESLFWLLLPVAAASGWFVARRSDVRSATKHAFPDEDYFRGLNYLLDNRPDKAIEIFLRLVEVNQDTVETHFALGSLFRRRGEVDRAIHVHQNLVARPSLSDGQRARALLELGEDYMKAGLFDRAEGLFKELVNRSAHVSEALTQLAAIYQQERDWELAIESCQALEQVSGDSQGHIIAHLYCELAVEARAADNPARFNTLLRRALESDTRCVRASLMQAEQHQQAAEYESAIRVLNRVEGQDPELLAETLPGLIRCHQALDQEQELIDHLSGVLERHPTGHLTSVLADLYLGLKGRDAAERFLLDALRSAPSAPGLKRLIELKLEHDDGAQRRELADLFEVGSPMLEVDTRYRCRHCGFEGRSLHWRCPSCQHWNAMRLPRDVSRTKAATSARHRVAASVGGS
jgi:lipopolysaccharide biosynthesis regulator YciM